MTLVFAYGTRPEAVKLGPVVAAVRTLGIKPLIVATGQHSDLLAGTPAETDLADGVSLNLQSTGNVPRYLATAQAALHGYFKTMEEMAVVVVQGDTMSALAGARAAVAAGHLVAHVEAGVRSHDLDDPWPEEENRRTITGLASWHYAASTTAYANLLTEGVAQSHIRLTGNPGISALARYTGITPQKPQPYLVVTLHRRELMRDQLLDGVLRGLVSAATEHSDVEFYWPIHPSIRPHLNWPQTVANIKLADPIPYREMVLLLARATGVVTDSGGLQEEAAALGVPCICLRRVTDRPESIEAGTAERRDPTEVGVTQGVEILVRGRLERRPLDCYGDATAADQIARHLVSLV